MKLYLSFSVIIRVIAGVILFWALAQHSYGYYILLRWVVSGVSAYCVYLSYIQHRSAWTWAFGMIAFIFNPIIPVGLDRITWGYLDPIVGILFLVSIYFIKEINTVEIIG